MSGFRLVGLLIGITGVILLLGLDVAGRPGEFLGALAILVATACYAVGVFIVKRNFSEVNPIGAVAVALAISTVMLAPAGIASIPGAEISGGAVGSIAVLGAFCSALALILFFTLIGEVGPTRASVITYVNPAVAVVLGVTLLGESLGPAAVAGLLLILAGSWISTGGGLPPGLAAVAGARRRRSTKGGEKPSAAYLTPTMDATRRHTNALVARLRERLAQERRSEAAAGRLGGDVAGAISALVEREAAILPAAKRAELTRLVTRETVGLGPLEDLLADPAVEEVMVNGHSRVYVERGGRIEVTPVEFSSDADVREAIERILAPTGRRVDELSPMADARLEDGSRVNVVVPPLAVDGPAISIRRFGVRRPGPDELVASGSLSPLAAERWRRPCAGGGRCSSSGGTGSGKTTLLNALSAWIGADGARDHDRGRGRASPPPAARRPPGVPPRLGRGQGRGHDSRPPSKRAADEARPDRDRRGARRRGARPSDRAQHGPRRCALDAPCELARGRSAPPRDAGAHGWCRPSSRGDSRPGRPRRGRDRACPARARREAPGLRSVGSRRGPQGRSVCGSSGAVEPRSVSGGAGRRARRRCGARRRSRHSRRRGMAGAGDRPGQACRPRGLRAERGRAPPSWPHHRGGASWVRRMALRSRPGGAACRSRARRPRAGPCPPGLRATGARSRGRCPRVAIATADALAAGRSVRSALDASSGSLEGPAAAEMSRLRADLDLGVPLESALGGLRERIRSHRVDSFSSALLSQRIAGGDLVSLLRRYAEAAAGRERVEADARSATAQARFTGVLVAAMPAGAALLAELLHPGFVTGMLASPASLVLIALSLGLQIAGFAAISRLGRVASLT